MTIYMHDTYIITCCKQRPMHTQTYVSNVIPQCSVIGKKTWKERKSFDSFQGEPSFLSAQELKFEKDNGRYFFIPFDEFRRVQDNYILHQPIHKWHVFINDPNNCNYINNSQPNNYI